MQDGHGNPLWATPPDESGTVPGMLVKMPQSWWKTEDSFKFEDTGGLAADQSSSVWDATWYSPLFDLRPEFRQADEITNAATPINRSPALGGGVFMRVLFVNQPAAFGDCEFFVRMEGHVYQAAGFYRLTEEIDITTTVLAGGTTVGGRVGASPFSCEPPADGLRFWRVVIRASQTVVVGNQPRVYGLKAAVY